MKYIVILILLLSQFVSSAANISGQVKDAAGQPLPFSSITVKGTAQGTTANSQGYYNLTLPAGNFVLVVQHIGYKRVEKDVAVVSNELYIDFNLELQEYDLGNVTVKNGEDPALAIIRNTIAKRSFYLNENPRFKVDVYIKGRVQLRDFPSRLFGQKIDFEDGDTSKRKVIFLSETVAHYAVDDQKTKIEVVSTKVSGQSDAFGFSDPQIFSFYQENIDVGNLNPRGFISPIADNALNYYRYKFEGTFFDGGQMVNRIKVTPKRAYEPLFNGYMNIVDNEWRIHSLQLVLYKQNQMQFADTLTIEQQYVPIGKTWVIKQQTLYPSFKFLGFDGFGSFVQVFDNYDLDAEFQKGFFNSTIIKFADSANKKPRAYWDSIRPIPLVDVEIKDYEKKEQLELARNSPAYLDSIDKVRNKVNVAALLTTGQSFSNQKNHSSVYFSSLLSAVSFNTIEGLVVALEPVYTRRWNVNKRNRLTISPLLRYGFSNHHFNPALTVGYTFGKKYFSAVEITGGKKVFQFDNRNPVPTFSNTLSTLYWERNYLKIYEATTGKITFTKGLGEGFTGSIFFEHQDRDPLVNTTDYKWRDLEERTFTPNITFTPHKASIAGISLTWQPGARYIEYPERKVLIGSAYPTLTASFKHGFPTLLGSDVDYSKWRVGLSHNINMKLAGSFAYNVSAGGFFNAKSAYLPDYNHYISNRFSGAAPYLQSFQLMHYYSYSNTQKIYGEQHAEYHLSGLLTNKIPGFKKLNWFLVTGNNLLYINGGQLYGEVFAGLENILKVGRIDVVQSFTNRGWESSGIRFSFAGMLR